MGLRQLRQLRRLLAATQAYLDALPPTDEVLAARLVIATDLARVECEILGRLCGRRARMPRFRTRIDAGASVAPGACCPTPKTKRPASETPGAFFDACVHLRGEC